MPAKQTTPTAAFTEEQLTQLSTREVLVLPALAFYLDIPASDAFARIRAGEVSLETVTTALAEYGAAITRAAAALATDIGALAADASLRRFCDRTTKKQVSKE